MRYCEKCGCALKGTGRFCPDCGARCASAQPHSRTSTKGKYYREKKSKLPIIITVAALILVASVLVISAGIEKDREKTAIGEKTDHDSSENVEYANQREESGLISIAPPKAERPSKLSGVEIRNATNNLQNLNYATDGEWLYFNNRGLCKTPLLDEGETIRVFDNYHPWGMYCLGGKLYFSIGSGSYMYLDIGNLTENPICPVSGTECFQTDGVYYYVCYEAHMKKEQGIYRINVDDPSKSERIFEALPTRLMLHGDYLYVFSPYGTINGIDNPYYGIWRIDLDGSNPICILKNLTNYIILSEDRIYCQDDDYSLFSVALDGTARRDYGVKFDHGLNVNDEYIFYIDKDTRYLHRMNLDGTDNRCLVSQMCSEISLLGDWLIYSNDEVWEYCKLNLSDNLNYQIEIPG